MIQMENIDVQIIDEDITNTHSIECFLDKLSEDELIDLQTTIYELMDEYLETSILSFSKPHFYEDFIEETAHVVYQQLYVSDVCEENDYDELCNYVEELSINLFEIDNIPLRSQEHFIPQELSSAEFADISSKIDLLLNSPQPKQRTKEWYDFRHNLMTASNLSKVFGSESDYNSLIYEKCKPVVENSNENEYVNTTSPMHWGNKYEPVTAMLYEEKNNTKIGEFGCIRHSKHSFIGASPDGIVTQTDSPLFGRMIEIKNIFNRDINGIPIEKYWIQMQLQLETCNLDVCDYVETRFKEYESVDEFYSAEIEDPSTKRGVILYFVSKFGMSSAPVYKYMPLTIPTDKTSIQQWIDQTIECFQTELVLCEIKYWYLDEYSCVTVKRNRKWFEAALPNIRKAWETIETERVNGYEHRAAKKRKPDIFIDTDTIGDGSIHYIRNMPSINNNICLIKLDSSESL